MKYTLFGDNQVQCGGHLVPARDIVPLLNRLANIEKAYDTLIHYRIAADIKVIDLDKETDRKHVIAVYEAIRNGR